MFKWFANLFKHKDKYRIILYQGKYIVQIKSYYGDWRGLDTTGSYGPWIDMKNQINYCSNSSLAEAEKLLTNYRIKIVKEECY